MSNWYFKWRAADGSRSIAHGGYKSAADARRQIAEQAKALSMEGWYEEDKNTWQNRYGDSMWVEEA